MQEYKCMCKTIQQIHWVLFVILEFLCCVPDGQSDWKYSLSLRLDEKENVQNDLKYSLSIHVFRMSLQHQLRALPRPRILHHKMFYETSYLRDFSRW